MRGVSAILFVGVLMRWSTNAVFLNHRPFPTYSLENMPETQFTCREKILGGYYADPDAQCQMFHVCVKVAGIGIQDFRFLCPNGTAFDQDHQICAEWEDVDCDASTLYYSSDNFDLYRIGSGFESKAVRYGEDEETFALQRAETGDIRLNREPQTQVVNQQKDYRRPQPKKNYNNNNNQERDIFKGSSSSNFFNNRNNGKENDDDYDDNANINQNNDYQQRRKSVRKLERRPNQQAQQPQPQQPQPQQPTSNRGRGQRQRNNGVNQNTNVPTPGYTISTPAPFRQSTSNRVANQYNNNGQYYTSSTENYPQSRSTSAPVKYNPNYDIQKQTKQTENYPQSRSTSAPVKYNPNYDIQKQTKQTENYPSNNPIYSKSTTPVVTSFNTGFNKEPSSPLQFESSKATTFSPSAKPFSFPSSQATQQNSQSTSGLPTTLAPRTQQAFTQLSQKTSSFNNNAQTAQSTTQKSSPFTQYTPTVPKIAPTTPVSRSSRFDETQYDDGSYNSKYEYNGGGDDEFLKTAHSQNIASSRNELAKVQRQQQTTSVSQKAYETPSTNAFASRSTENYPKSTQFSSTRNTQVTQKPAVPQVPQKSSPKPANKKSKDVSYDYAYYDSGLAAESDYQLDLDIKKSSSRK